MSRNPFPKLVQMDKELHHHIRYLEIYGDDVVCHIKNPYIHENIHYALPYKIEKKIVDAAQKRLRKNHDKIKHITFEEMINYYKSQNIHINLGDDSSEMVKWVGRNGAVLQIDENAVNTSSACRAFYLVLPELLKKYRPDQIFYKRHYDLCPICLFHFKQPKYQVCMECFDKSKIIHVDN